MQRGDGTRHLLASLTSEERRLLGVLGFTFLLNQYDMALLGLALPQIQAGIGLAETEVGPLLGTIRLGAGAALVLALAADRAGRRRLLLFTILGFTLCTTLTALAPDPAAFLACQLGARACIAAEEVIAIVLVAEEVGARARGLGFGILAIFGAVGHGLAAIAFGFVESLPFGWRALYALGAVPLLVLGWIRRSLRESRRFESEPRRGSVLQPLLDLLGVYPARLAALLTAILGFGFVSATALSFVSKTLQELHGYAPHEVSFLMIGGGSLALVSYPLSGVLSDRFGRRRVLGASLAAMGLGVLVFYSTTGVVLVVAWTFMMMGFMACDVLFGALGTELFPTGHRATASGVRMLVLAGGGALGLWAEGLVFGQAGSHALAITWLALGAVPIPLLALLALPETAERELEDISPPATPKGETP